MFRQEAYQNAIDLVTKQADQEECFPRRSDSRLYVDQ